MSVLLGEPIESQVSLRMDLRFHRLMAYTCSVLLIVTLLACKLESIHIQNPLGLALSLAFITAVVFIVAVYLHEKGRANLRDAITTIPWGVFLLVTVPLSVIAAARLGMPLQDAHLTRLDRLFGVNVPQIVVWSSHHWIGEAINKTYPLLAYLLTVSALLPALTGKVKSAQLFVLANLIAFIIGIPLFAAFPAIGPWYGYPFAATSGQIECQTAILLFREPSHLISHLGAIICFPSFHVIWAIFCAAALWEFRLLRIPVCVFAGMIVLSTVTTGWHYFTDLVGGVILAILSLIIANASIKPRDSGCRQPERESGQ